MANVRWQFSSTSKTWRSAFKVAATASTSSASSSAWSRRARSSARRPTPTGAGSATYTTPLHEAAIELIEIPRRAQTGKNSADIRLCVDAMDLAYSKEHIDTFVDRLRRQRFLAAGVETEGTRQARHRPGHAAVHVRPASRQLRRVHLLRRPRPDVAMSNRPSTPSCRKASAKHSPC